MWVCPHHGDSQRPAEGVSFASGWGPQGPGRQLWGAGRGSRGWPCLPGEGWWARGRRHALVTQGGRPQPSPACPQTWMSAACSLTCAPMASASITLAPSAATAGLGTRLTPRPQPAWVSPLPHPGSLSVQRLAHTPLRKPRPEAKHPCFFPPPPAHVDHFPPVIWCILSFSVTLCSRCSSKSGSANSCPRAESSPPLIFVNKVLLAHGHAYLFPYPLWLFSCYRGRVE